MKLRLQIYFASLTLKRSDPWSGSQLITSDETCPTNHKGPSGVDLGQKTDPRQPIGVYDIGLLCGTLAFMPQCTGPGMTPVA